MPNDHLPTTIEMLAQIVTRPGMYWGDSANHFHSLVAFLSGYHLSRGADQIARLGHPLDRAVPDDFHQFVTEHFGHQFPYGGHGWNSLIEEHSASDQEALVMFLKLRKLYDQKNGEQIVAANRP